MPMVIVGTLLLIAKLAEFGPFAHLSWWLVLAPFGIAVLWWEFADASGWTKRRVMDKMEERKVKRREAAMNALGLDHRREQRATEARQAAARRVSADPTQAEPNPSASRREPRP